MTDQATSAWDSRVSRVYFISDAYGYVKIGTSLDVEMAPALTSDYWRAWSAAFDAVPATDTTPARPASELLPAVYMPNMNFWPASWDALEHAVAGGARCSGTWVALYHQAVDGNAVLREEAWTTRPKASTAVPMLAWQHTGNAYKQRYDFSSVNPDDSDWLADMLPAPVTLRSPEVPRASSETAPLTEAARMAAELAGVP